jgi:hypothetical protein
MDGRLSRRIDVQKDSQTQTVKCMKVCICVFGCVRACVLDTRFKSTCQPRLSDYCKQFLYTYKRYGLQNLLLNVFIGLAVFVMVKWVPCRGPEQRESGKTVLYPLIIINILMSNIITHY